MDQSYPFDPTDWSTIIPLYETLRDAPVADGEFMAWLEDWNQLDIAIWDAYTQLKRPAYVDMHNHEAEKIYQAYVQELYSTYLDLTQKLMKRALTLQPEPPGPQYIQLWRYWHNQITLFHPDSIPIQAEISRLEGRYRDIMNNYEASPDHPLAYWMERRGELNDLMMALLKQRRALARVSGMPNFLAYRWRELNRLDYAISDLRAFHHAVEASVVPLIAEHKLYETHNFIVPEISDPAELAAAIERLLYRLDTAFGDVFHAMRDGYLDLGSREHKVPTLESWFFPRTGMPYLHVGANNAGPVLHESGHAIHHSLSFQAQGSMWNYAGPDEFQEFVGVGMEMLGWPYYEDSQGGLFTTAESAAARKNALGFYVETLTSYVMHDAFEHWVYGEAPADVTPADFDAKWLEIKQRFAPWDNDYTSQAEAATGWQRWTWSLFRMPLYLITYPLAVVGVSQLHRLVAEHGASAIESYKAAMILGNTQPVTALFQAVGIEFPFSPEAVAAAAQFVVEQTGQITDSP